MKLALHVLLLVLTLNASAQALVFKDPTKKSGTDLKKGAVYIFKDVTTGVNAEVTIKDLVNGATVSKIDDNGGGVGYLNAFQPEIKTGSKGESYAVFSVRLIEKTTNSLYLLKKLQATALDIDGTSELREFDEINMNGGTAAYMGGTLQISLKSLPIIGTLLNNFRADNITGVDKNGIDTLSKGNMYTVSNNDVNSFELKLGAKTTTNNNIERQYSIYMQGFQYPNLAILPVKLISFTTTLKGNQSVIDWTTTSEDKLSSFIIERSIDGKNFTVAGSVSPKGNMTAITSYSFTENCPNAPVVYYRLKSLDLDGKFAYSSVGVVRNSSKSSIVSAYPNPFTTSLIVSCPVSFANNPVTVELFSTNGQLIKKIINQGNNTVTLETAGLEKGLYVVRVSNGTETNQFKVVKN